MKKLSSLIIALFVLSAGTVFAQVGNVNVNAEIATALDVTVNDNLNFGILSGDVDGYLSTGADGETASTGILSGQQLGNITITGSANESITLSFSNSVTLTRLTGTGGDLTYTPFLSYDDTGTQTEVISGTTNVSLDEAGGTKEILVGGGVNSSAETSGTFEGTLEITAEYVSI